MARPCKQRFVGKHPSIVAFKPQGIPLARLDEIALSLDELEAIRLADLNGDLHEEAAAKMDVSRATFGRILGTARRKVAEALMHGKALRITGGSVQEVRRSRIRCRRCRRQWEVPVPVVLSFRCPQCAAGA